MDDEEILQLVEDGVIDPDDISEFRDLDPELQELVANGDLDMGERINSLFFTMQLSPED